MTVNEIIENEDTGEADVLEGEDYESKALDQGWTPKEEFKGDASKWVDAQTFVERGGLKTQLRNSETKINDLTTKLSDLEKQIKQHSDTSSKKLQKELAAARKIAEHALNTQKKQFEAKYEEAKRQAVADGDPDEYDRLQAEHAEKSKEFSEPQFEEELEELEEPEAEKKTTKKDEGLSEDQQKTIDNWVGENPWFNNDTRMASYAKAAHQDIFKQNPNISLEDSLKQLSDEMREEFPHKFEGKKQPSSLAGGSRVNGGAASKKKGWGDLSSEARENLKFYIKNKTFADEKTAAAHYWSLNDD